MSLSRRKKMVDTGSLLLSREEGQNSVCNSLHITRACKVGNLTMQTKTDKGSAGEVYDVAFAVVFTAFLSEGMLHYFD